MRYRLGFIRLVCGLLGGHEWQWSERATPEAIFYESVCRTCGKRRVGTVTPGLPAENQPTGSTLS